MDLKPVVSGVCSFMLSQASTPLLNPMLGEPLKALAMQFPIAGGYLMSVPAASILSAVSFLFVWLIVGGVMNSLRGIGPIILTAVIVVVIMMLLMRTEILAALPVPTFG